MNKIKYIFFSTEAEYVKFCLSEIIHDESVIYNRETFLKKGIRRLSSMILKKNSSIKSFLYLLWFRKKWVKSNEIPLFFFYEFNRMSCDKGFLEYLKKKYPLSKFVYNFTNATSNSKSNGLEFILKNPLLYDLVLTYCEDDVKKYGFTFYQWAYSPINRKKTERKDDLYFVGIDKGRGELVREIAQMCKQNNIKYNFNIFGNQTSHLDEELGINTRIKKISYHDNINNILNSKCVLELVPNGVLSCTLRTAEIIATGTKLLTNNTALKNDVVFNAAQMQVFSSLEDIDIEFIRSEFNAEFFNDKDILSPKYLLQFLKEKLF